MTDPLRLLVVTVVHDPQDARIRHREIAALVDAGHQVTYAAPFTAYGRADAAPLAATIDLPRARGRRRLRAVRAARRLLARRARDFDVVLLHDPDLLAAVPGLGRRLRGVVVVWDVHEDTAAAVGMRDWIPAPVRPVARAVIAAAERWAERRVELLLAEHSYTERFRRSHPVVPNSVAIPPPPPPPGDRRAVYLGRVTAARGGHELVALGAELARRDSPVVLEVIGNADGALGADLTDAADRGELRWHGFVPNDVARGMLDGALVGLSLLTDEPNYAHSQPTKVMEYMAHGVPVVTTPNPASRAVVEEAGAGLVVPFGDVPTTADAVERLHTEAALRERMGTAGRTAAERDFDWRRDAVEFVRTLETWVQQARSAHR